LREKHFHNHHRHSVIVTVDFASTRNTNKSHEGEREVQTWRKIAELEFAILKEFSACNSSNNDDDRRALR
jgi:hypothetical protein